jgi:4a-hydroxytetrahydrobiopterin dehydratase
MKSLAEMKCVPTQEGEPTIAGEEVAQLEPQVPEWQVLQEKGVKHLKRVFSFDDLARALAFTNRVGEIAEEEDHHPVLVTEWDRVTVTWWTHKIGGLHRNDFAVAAKTDRLYEAR